MKKLLASTALMGALVISGSSFAETKFGGNIENTWTSQESMVDGTATKDSKDAIGNDIEIIRSGKTLKLKCDGDFANQETSIECPEESPNISGLYSLKYLNIFTKATAMCASVQIIQEISNRFLILKYDVANLGELKFYLATKVSEDP